MAESGFGGKLRTSSDVSGIRQAERRSDESLTSDKLELNEDHDIPDDLGHLVGFSARPHLVGDVLESKLFKTFKGLQLR